MYKLIFLILITVALAFGQVEQGQDVSTDNGNIFLASDTDSVYWENDSLNIYGADTAFVFIRTGRTNGMMAYKGHVETEDDSVHIDFDMAIHKGINPRGLDSFNANTFYTLKTIQKASGDGKQGFYFRPFDNANLDQVYTWYYCMRIVGYAGHHARIWIIEERVNAY